MWGSKVSIKKEKDVDATLSILGWIGESRAVVIN